MSEPLPPCLLLQCAMLSERLVMNGAPANAGAWYHWCWLSPETAMRDFGGFLVNGI